MSCPLLALASAATLVLNGFDQRKDYQEYSDVGQVVTFSVARCCVPCSRLERSRVVPPDAGGLGRVRRRSRLRCFRDLWTSHHCLDLSFQMLSGYPKMIFRCQGVDQWPERKEMERTISLARSGDFQLQLWSLSSLMLQKKNGRICSSVGQRNSFPGNRCSGHTFCIFLHLFMFCQYFCTIFPCVAFAPRHQTGQWPWGASDILWVQAESWSMIEAKLLTPSWKTAFHGRR